MTPEVPAHRANGTDVQRIPIDLSGSGSAAVSLIPVNHINTTARVPNATVVDSNSTSAPNISTPAATASHLNRLRSPEVDAAAAAQTNSSSSRMDGSMVGSGSSSNNMTEVATPDPTLPAEVHGVPSNPTLVTAVAHDGRAEVSWKAPEDDGFDPIIQYEVAWFDEQDNSLVGTQTVEQIASTTPMPTVTEPSAAGTNGSAANDTTTTSAPLNLVPTSTIVTHLANGLSYTFKVRAKNVNGYSTWSAKSLAVSPLHPPDLCERVSCSGHGTCFPNYQVDRSRSLQIARQEMAADESDDVARDARCICRPGYSPPDCSVKKSDGQYEWRVSEWSACDSGCGGGKRTREATCHDLTTDAPAPEEALCTQKKPSTTGICNGMECGSKLVSVKYKVEMSYDEVLFSPDSTDAFENAFMTEVSAALQIPRTRLEVTALKRGSIVTFFQILPPSKVGERSLNDVVEDLQQQLSNDSSTLRSKGTFARRVEPGGVKLSFSIADQTAGGGAEDISIAGLIGTVLVLVGFVSLFGWFLRRRHERIVKMQREVEDPKSVIEAPRSEMKRMSIRTMA
ncbi:TPA: hypothetical protein N0F65_012181 [Lagenidium giganteum]|uniref:Fibronectin type-III domain-containing protein n=1 Tax=Lagenidium giganteum TaxID=4803 RepID=A0AAV2ZC63_9STRA|nr:TPA: hypothetical protein N0F65_012181 [Lagenidium giganteum]